MKLNDVENLLEGGVEVGPGTGRNNNDGIDAYLGRTRMNYGESGFGKYVEKVIGYIEQNRKDLIGKIRPLDLANPDIEFDQARNAVIYDEDGKVLAKIPRSEWEKGAVQGATKNAFSFLKK